MTNSLQNIFSKSIRCKMRIADTQYRSQVQPPLSPRPCQPVPSRPDDCNYFRENKEFFGCLNSDQIIEPVFKENDR